MKKMVTIRSLTPDLWPAVEDLFGKNGACDGCWCMYWRIGTAYRTTPGEKNKAMFRKVVQSGPPPGLLAFDGDIAVGWCQLTPRDALPWFAKRRRSAPANGTSADSLQQGRKADPDGFRGLGQQAGCGHARQRIGFQTPKAAVCIASKIDAAVST
jgi:hypothetical protein